MVYYGSERIVERLVFSRISCSCNFELHLNACFCFVTVFFVRKSKKLPFLCLAVISSLASMQLQHFLSGICLTIGSAEMRNHSVLATKLMLYDGLLSQYSDSIKY